MAEVMVTRPKVLTVSATVGAVRAMLDDDHVHLVLLVDGALLRGTLAREDLPSCARSDEPAMSWARLDGRTIEPQAPAEPVRLEMLGTRRRRLVVVDDQGTLLGLLCLKRQGHGYCSDDDVEARHAVPGKAPVAGDARHPVRWDPSPAYPLTSPWAPPT